MVPASRLSIARKRRGTEGEVGEKQGITLGISKPTAAARDRAMFWSPDRDPPLGAYEAKAENGLTASLTALYQCRLCPTQSRFR
jgi:hypothetical protein